MVLDLPDVINAEPVGELDLVERLLVELQLGIFLPRLRQLVLVEKPELLRLVSSLGYPLPPRKRGPRATAAAWPP